MIEIPSYSSSSVSYGVDVFLPTSIKGWIRYLDLDTPALLELLVNEKVVGLIRADFYRTDLKKMRKDGCFAFDIFPFSQDDWQAKVAQNAFVQLRLKGSDQVIGETIWNGLAPLDQSGVLSSCGANMRLNKGHFVIPLSERSDEWKFELISNAAKLAAVSGASDFNVCTTYGTLLGAIRDGSLIGHDDDIDLMFISNETTMLKAVEDFIRYQSFLKANGYEVHDLSNGQIHARLNSDFPVDIFLSWFEDKKLNLTFTIRASVPLNDVFPLAEVTLLGVALPIPNKPELLLEAIYGSNWKFPDPAFVWARPKDIIDYFAPIHNYSRGENADYWRDYYSKRVEVPAPQIPSQFSLFALSIRSLPDIIIDLGCGNGRDALFFGSQGIRTIGLDYADSAIAANESAALDLELAGLVSFRQIDVSDLGQVKKTVDFVNEVRTNGPLCVYSRFFFHALNENTESSALLLVSQILTTSRDYAVFEFRTDQDSELIKATPAHYRRYINVDAFLNKATTMYGMLCKYRIEGTGFAIFKEDDAYVVRLLLVKG